MRVIVVALLIASSSNAAQCVRFGQSYTCTDDNGNYAGGGYDNGTVRIYNAPSAYGFGSGGEAEPASQRERERSSWSYSDGDE